MRIKIGSSSNEFYKHLKRLHTSKERNRTSRYLAEGSRAVFDAVRNGADIYAVVLREGQECNFDLTNIRVYELSSELYDALKLTVNSQGIMAVIRYKIKSLSEFDFSIPAHVLYLDSVSDPGNMGTILRSADAMGVDAVICSSGCVDVFNPKVVRSSMASLLNVPLYMGNDESLNIFKNAGYDIVGTFPKGNIQSCDYDYKDKSVLVMGNEANGISDSVTSLCTSKVTIPMLGNADSLNVATACTVMLYEMMLSKLKK